MSAYFVALRESIPDEADGQELSGDRKSKRLLMSSRVFMGGWSGQSLP